jgi:argininosuccinate synthase
MNLKVRVTNYKDIIYAFTISKNIEESAILREIGIAKRDTKYIASKILEGNAVFAIFNGIIIGFSYIETFQEEFIAHSGMIVFPTFRKKGISKCIKSSIFKLSSYKFPIANIFSITTSPPIIKINFDLNFKIVSFLEITNSYRFWDGCNSCNNYDFITNNNKMCLCNAFLFEPKHFLRDKIVLAYSGGLDTSYCLQLLTEQGYEVYTVQVNTGGFSKLELKNIEENAYSIGTKYHRIIDATNFYYDYCIKYLIFGNVLRNNIYPLSVSSERIFQAIKVAEYANEIDAIAIAHGSTCAGNDQIRFDIAFQILCPDKRILSPIRDNQCSRQEEMNYLREHGIDILWTKARYSINKGLWGISISGEETLTSYENLPSEAYPISIKEMESKNIQLGFEKGEFISINREKSYSIKNIIKLEQIASKFAIGRDIHIGDTLIGIKGRVGLQASSAIILIKAHQLLEKHILTKWQIYWKEQLSNWYGMFLHEAQYLEPVMRNIESFLKDSQNRVNGEVYIKLSPYKFELIGVRSNFDLMQSKNEKYGETNEDWNAEDAKGFIKIFGKQIKMYHSIKND